MIQSLNPRNPFVLRRMLLDLHQNILNFYKPRTLQPFLGVGENPRFYVTKMAAQSDDSGVPARPARRITAFARSKAQAALLDYLHSTRCVPFDHAEHMSKHSPHFLKKILTKLHDFSRNTDVQHSIARLLRYHPVNEFEPFFESSGLKPCEFGPILPRLPVFMIDVPMLLENYSVLCNYGVARDRIGKIYMEAAEIFQYGHGVLELELAALEGELGSSSSSVIAAVQRSPHILIRNVHVPALSVWRELKALGIDCSSMESYFLEGSFYNWSQILKLIRLFKEIYSTKQELRGLVIQHWQVLFEDSGNDTYRLIGVLLKFGCTMDQVKLVFLQFPKVQVGKFLLNMRTCINFFIEFDMEAEEIKRLVQSDAVLLGSCSLKKTNSLVTLQKSGRKRICRSIKESPEVLKKWVLKSMVVPLTRLEMGLTSLKKRTEVLLNLGFIEDSPELKTALKHCRGSGQELQERLDCFLKAGLDRSDVLRAIKLAPNVLNQSKEAIERKFDFLINTVGYPMTSLLAYPASICLAIETIKHRMAVYAWLRDQGLAKPNLALATIITKSHKLVNRHPQGPKVWEDLKKQNYSK